MGINLRNGEGYLDTTAYEALKNIERQEKEKKKQKRSGGYIAKEQNPLVFICSPFAGDIEGNTKRAKEYGRFAVSKGEIPVIPHLMYPQILAEEDPNQRKLGIEMGLVLLTKCRELWFFGEYLSEGMNIEITKANELRITIRQFSSDCILIGGNTR